MWKTSLIKHEKVGWNRYFIKKLSTQKQSAYESVKSYVFVWIKLVKKFLNFSLLTRTRLNCYIFSVTQNHYSYLKSFAKHTSICYPKSTLIIHISRYENFPKQIRQKTKKEKADIRFP